jgi:2-oxopent-4-enoate/cis-2-oxohex-4-enoate hydratase
MERAEIERLGDALYSAMCDRSVLAPLTDSHPNLTIEQAYEISLRFLANRLNAGEKIVGKKIGVTSAAVMDMLGVRQPDFGFMTDAMRHDDVMAISGSLIQPRAEGEIAFLLKKDLQGPGLTNADVLAATEAVMPCFEVVDSRIKDWQIKIQDTVADNASCGWFALNEAAAISPTAVDLINCEMTVCKNGEVISAGTGAAAMGNPVNCITWLANTLGTFGITLEKGDVVLSGSLVPLEPVSAGDEMGLQISGMGDCRVAFT